MNAKPILFFFAVIISLVSVYASSNSISASLVIADDDAVNTGGSSGGGSSGGVSITTENQDDKSYSITIDNTKTQFTQVQIFLEEQVEGYKVSFAKVDKPKILEGLVTGPVYQYIKVDSTIDSAKIKKVEIRFSVEKSWLTANSASPDSIVLHRCSDTGSCSKLPVNILTEDKDYFYFKALSPGFSYFVISIEPIYAVKTKDGKNTTIELIANNISSKQDKGLIGITGAAISTSQLNNSYVSALVLLLIFVLSYLIYRRLKK
ncbi:MAG: PGF-pre-PGF domain-containing protein [Nanoarchaeota archaeon]